MPEKAPADRLAKDEGFTFTVKGKKYRLPKIGEDAALKVPGGVTQDALMYPDDAGKQMALAFHLMQHVGAKPDALEALRSMSTKDMLETVGEWMGEGSGSSE